MSDRDTENRTGPGTEHATERRTEDRTERRTAPKAPPAVDRIGRLDKPRITERPITERPERAPGAAVPAPRTPPEPAVGPGAAIEPEPAAKPPAEPVAEPDRTPAVATGGTEEVDRLGRRMDRAVGGFVDDPRRSVREADAVLDEAAARLTRLLEERRSTLRGSWHGDNGERTGTEELRIALTKYRDMTRQLLTTGI